MFDYELLAWYVSMRPHEVVEKSSILKSNGCITLQVKVGDFKHTLGADQCLMAGIITQSKMDELLRTHALEIKAQREHQAMIDDQDKKCGIAVLVALVLLLVFGGGILFGKLTK